MAQEKVWFITGASQGLGLALTRQLLEQGKLVVATSRNPDNLVTSLGTNISDGLLPLRVELGNDASVADAVQQAVDRFGRIDVVVNNAGYGIGGSLEELSDKEVRDSFDINVFATVNVIRHILPVMRGQSSGHIINISSIAGIAPTTGWAAYAAAKHAVIGLTEVLAQDVKDLGIKVTLIAPGAFRTNFNNPDSAVLSEKRIDAYAQIRAAQDRFAKLSGKQIGDPVKAAKVMIDLAEMPEPPLYLLLGSDAFTRANDKLALLGSTFKDSEQLTRSTDWEEQ